MNFCKKCSGMLVPRAVNNETLMLCNRCGWFEILKDKEVDLKSKDSFFHEEKGEGVANKALSNEGYKHKCKNCGNDFVEILEAGARYTDEDNLILLRCLKCGASERLGRKCT